MSDPITELIALPLGLILVIGGMFLFFKFISWWDGEGG